MHQVLKCLQDYSNFESLYVNDNFGCLLYILRWHAMHAMHAMLRIIFFCDLVNMIRHFTGKFLHVKKRCGRKQTHKKYTNKPWSDCLNISIALQDILKSCFK